ncbi:MAG: PAS domain S-box protein [Acidobacteriota bacterium]
MDNLSPFNLSIINLSKLELSHLNEHRETLQSILDMIPEGIFIARAPDGVPILMNRCGKELRGEIPDSMTLRDYEGYWRLEYLDGSEVPGDESPLRRALHGETVQQQPYRFYNHKGEMGYQLINAGPLRQADGTVFAIVVVFCDITEKWETQKNLQHREKQYRDSEKRYRLLFEKNLAGVYRGTLEGQIIDCNEAYAQLLGFASREEVLALNASDLYFQKAEREAFIRQLTAQGSLTNLELCLRKKDGSAVWVLANVNLIGDPGEDEPFIEETLIDITDRKVVEEALRVSEERFSKAFNASPIPMSLSHYGCFIDVNNSFLQATGYSREEVIGHTTAELGLWVDEENQRELVAHRDRHIPLKDMEARYRTKWGELRYGLFCGESIMVNGNDCFLATITDITEWKIAELALRASEERFSKAFHANPLHMAILTLQGARFVDVNESFLDHSGYRREELIGHTVDEIGLWAYPEERDNLLRLFNRQKRVKDFEVRFRKRSGEIMIGLMSVEPILLVDEPCLLTATLDITERKKQEEQLIKAQREWRTTFDAMPDSVLLTDANDRLIRANKAFFERTNLTYEEAIGRNVGRLLHPDDSFISEEFCPLCQLRATKTRGTIELPAGVVSGYPLLASIEPVFDDHGNHTATVQVFRDLTALYSAREEVEQERGSLKATIEQLADALIIFDETGKVVRANQAAQKLFGFKLEQMVSDYWINLVDGLFTDKEGRLLSRDEQPVNLILHDRIRINNQIVWYTSPKGKRLLLSKTLSPSFNEQGKLTGVVSITRDITEQYREQERLQQADKLRALGQLASGVAHNFNNALAAVIGYSQLAVRKTNDPEIQGHLRLIEQSSRDAARMVERIQNFARSRAQQDEFTIAKISDIVRDAIDITRPRWRYEAEALGLNYGVSLDWEISEELFVKCEPSELREVFINLIFNALDAMPEGGSMSISGTVNENDVTINFKDTGIGMSEEVKNRIFDPFFTTKGAAGLGMGLSESYRIVERHNGHFTVESQPHYGTTFSIILPLAILPTVESINKPAEAPAAKKHILVIDDEEIVRRALYSIFENMGHEVAQAAGRDEALQLLAGSKFDFVITDLAMPDTDGIAIAKEIKALNPETKVLLMSGYNPDRVEERIKEVGSIDGRIAKPFKFEEIRVIIQDLLNCH